MSDSDARLFPLLRESVAVIRSQLVRFLVLMSTTTILIWLVGPTPNDVIAAVGNVIENWDNIKPSAAIVDSIKVLGRLLGQLAGTGSMILSIMAAIFHLSHQVARPTGDYESQERLLKRAIGAAFGRSLFRYGLSVFVVGMTILLLCVAIAATVGGLMFIVWLYSSSNVAIVIVFLFGLVVVPYLWMIVMTRLCLALPNVAIKGCGFRYSLTHSVVLCRTCRPLVFRVHLFYSLFFAAAMLVCFLVSNILAVFCLSIFSLSYIVCGTLLLQRAR